MEIFIKMVALMGVIGLVFGVLLAFANKKFAIEMNPLIHTIEEILPKGQCGACGFPGCQAYAEAVVLDKDVAPDLCIPGKAEVARKVAELTGKQADVVESRVAKVRCSQPAGKSKLKYDYSGIKDCLAASLLQQGPKACKYGCIGLGTCERHCPFDAIKLNEDGLPIVDEKKCTGCGKCEEVCPNHVMAMIPIGAHVENICSSHDPGAVKRKYCAQPCIGCGICKKACPHGAIEIANGLAVIDKHICMEKCDDPVCVDKCPTKSLQLLREEVRNKS